MFEIQPMNPEEYRQQTRRSSYILVAILAVLTISFATLSVILFGEPGGNNFRWNLGGIIAGLGITTVLVRLHLWQQPWMAPAVYGFRLKRNLMKVTNVMHHVETGVKANDPTAMKVLRFYHLGITQMHHLDGNTSAITEMVAEIDQHREHMQVQGIDLNQSVLDPEWLKSIGKQGRDDSN